MIEQSSLLEILALSIIWLCSLLDNHIGEISSETPQNKYVIVVATCELSDISGKIVLKPSKPACPSLSVTPGLNPTVIAISGGVGNNS